MTTRHAIRLKNAAKFNRVRISRKFYVRALPSTELLNRFDPIRYWISATGDRHFWHVPVSCNIRSGNERRHPRYSCSVRRAVWSSCTREASVGHTRRERKLMENEKKFALVKRNSRDVGLGENLFTGHGPTRMCNKKKKKQCSDKIVFYNSQDTCQYITPRCYTYRRHHPTRIFIGKQQVLYSTDLL